jgi:dipeptidyl aminopeptidase/acylaminoacyl peptidase
MRPLSNWASFFGTSDIGARFTKLSAGGVPWRDLDQLMRHSPIAYVEHIEAPLLLLHSENDLRCPVGETEQVFAALEYLGRDVRFVRFEQQSHDLSRNGHPRSREIRLRLISDWLRDHLGAARADTTRSSLADAAG